MKREILENFFITWGFLIFLNQIFIFGGCFAPYCILAALPHTGVIAFLINIFYLKNDTPKEVEKKVEKAVPKKKAKPKPKFTKQEEVKKEKDPLKEKGDRYEKFIGKQFENKGGLVIYNGFINGYKDQGVDIISISSKTNSINLIQCKNWTKKPMMLDDIKDIYEKLNKYDIEDITHDTKLINKYLQIKKSSQEIKLMLLEIDKNSSTIRKTLYVGSDKVIDLNIGKHLKLIKANIFRYKDMKIVIKPE